MLKYLLAITLLLPLAGCGVKQVPAVWSVNTHPMGDINALPPYSYFRDIGDNTKMLVWAEPNITLDKPCRLKYKPLEYNFFKMITVDGQIINGGKYPIIVDSGNKGSYLLVNDVIVNKSGLDVWTTEDSRFPYYFTGVRQLKIDDMLINDIPSVACTFHWELQVLGVPIYQNKHMLMGLSLMKQFKYVAFDNIEREVEFSYKQSFEPADSNDWDSFSLVLKPYYNSLEYCRLMVTIPVAGQPVSMEFDTGMDIMVLSPELWDSIRDKVRVKNVTKRKKQFYYYGYVNADYMTVDNLNVGNHNVPKASLAVITENGSCLSDISPGIFGLEYFRDTIVVLDFEHNCMMVRKLKLK